MLTVISNRHRRELARERYVIASILGDLVVIIVALLTAAYVRIETHWLDFVATDRWLSHRDYLPHVAMGTVLMILLLGNFRMYSPSYLHAVRRHWRIAGQVTALWTLAYLTFSLILKVEPPISRGYCLLGAVFAFGGLVAWRKVLNLFLANPAISLSIRQRVLFVGWSDECEKLLSTVMDETNHVYEIVGILPKSGWEPGCEPPESLARLGGLEEIQEILERQEVDVVLLTDNGLPKNELVRIALACERAMIDCKLIPSIFQILVSGLHLENLGGVPLLGISRLPLHSKINGALKRTVDLVGGSLGLVVSTPIIVLFALLIKLEDGGPLFYRQTRLGRNGQLFSIVKLRSMKDDAESDGRAGWTVKNDPRCLRVGAFMRRWNIDELPQFWNVLRGEMSLVGPRPERPELIARFKDEIVHYNARHNIKPGITGWAQVNGLRGDTDLRERIKFDLYYIEHWNLLLDFQIMAMTFFSHRNAC